jgi:hypothetical protein
MPLYLHPVKKKEKLSEKEWRRKRTIKKVHLSVLKDVPNQTNKWCWFCLKKNLKKKSSEEKHGKRERKSENKKKRRKRKRRADDVIWPISVFSPFNS